MSIREMTVFDVKEVAKVHLASFPNFFLSFLGIRFLETLYKSFIDDQESISLVYVDSHEFILGFVAGSVNPSGFYKRAIKRRAIQFAISSIPTIFKNPIIIPRLFEALKKPSESKDSVGDCFLMSIGVLPERKGLGLGKLLEKEFCNIAKGKGAKIIELTTDRDNNVDVNHFYIKTGYELYNFFKTKQGRLMNRYVKKI